MLIWINLCLVSWRYLLLFVCYCQKHLSGVQKLPNIIMWTRIRDIKVTEWSPYLIACKKESQDLKTSQNSQKIQQNSWEVSLGRVLQPLKFFETSCLSRALKRYIWYTVTEKFKSAAPRSLKLGVKMWAKINYFVLFSLKP